MFASLTGVLMLATTVTPLVTGAASYSDELKGAYEYAYSKNITTMSSIDNANMYGELTRGQLAKMIANWAEKEMGTKVDETAVCSFSDANTAEGDLATYVKKACQMGLMGQGIEKFRPNDKVTRGEFGTTLSRALWGDKYNGATPFYKNHLEALKEAGIMKMIDTPNQMEIRGYVMLMLQRSADVVSPAECKDPTVVLACSLNSDACPAKCKGKTPTSPDGKAGALNVTATAAPDRKIVVSGVGGTSKPISDLDAITFKADQDITLERVTLERYGFSSKDDVEAVWLEDEYGNKIADEKSLGSKDSVTLNIKKEYRSLKKEGTVTIVVQTAKGVKAGGTMGFKVTDVVSSAKDLNLAKYSPFTYDMVVFNGSEVTVKGNGARTNTYNYVEGDAYNVARFQLKAGNAALLVNGFTLTNIAGNKLDMTKFVDKVEVLANGTPLKGVTFKTTRDDKLVLSFDRQEVDMRGRVTYVVRATLKDFDDYSKALQLKINEASDFNAIEKKTQTRVSLKTDGTWTEHTFNGGRVRLNNAKIGTVDAAQGSSDVVFASGTIKLPEAVKISELEVVVTPSANSPKNVEAMSIALEGNEAYDAKCTTDKDSAPKKGVTTCVFKNVILEKSGKVQFKMDLDADTEKNITLESKIVVGANNYSSFNKGAFKDAIYDNSRKTVVDNDVAGGLTLEKVKVQPAKAALENKLSRDVEFLTNESTKKVVFDGTYTAKKGTVNLNSLKVVRNGGTPEVGTPNSITFYLSIDGNEVATFEGKNAGTSRDLTNEETFSQIKIEAGKKVNVKVEAEVDVDDDAAANYDYQMYLQGEDENGNDAGKADASLLKIKALKSGTVNLSTEAKDTVLLKGTNSTIAKFIVKPSNKVEGLKFDKIVLEAKKGADNIPASELRVKVDGEEFEVEEGTSLTYKPNKELPVDGLVVEVVYKPANNGDVKLTVKSVNDKDQNRVFNKKFVNALVKIARQENVGKAETRYTFSVEKFDGSEQVTDLKLYVGADEKSSLATVTDGDILEVANDPASVKYIDKITYKVGGAEETIEKAGFRDYFRVGDTFAKIFKAE